MADRPRLVTFHVAAPAEQSAAPPAAPAGLLSGIVAPYGTPTTRWGTQIQFAPGSVRLPDRLSDVKLLVNHDPDRPAGYAVEASESDAGLAMTFTLGGHPRSDELAGEVAGLLRDGLSVGIELDPDVWAELHARMWGESSATDPVTLTGQLVEVSAVTLPQFPDARTDTNTIHRQPVTFSTTGGNMSTITVPAPALDPPAPAPSFARVEPGTITAPPAPTLEELAAAVTERMGGHITPGAHPLARFATFSDYATAVRDDPTLQLALVDQITSANPGLVQPGWLTEVVGAIEETAPVTAALTVGGLPDGGMSFDWPTYTGDYKTLVAKQLTEKSEVHSALVSFGRSAQTPIETFAGGSDISYQLLRRSSPSYLSEYSKIMAMAYAWCIEDVMSDYLVAASGASVVADPLTANAAAIRAALFSASNKVRLATGRPATDVLVSPDVFAIWGGLTGLENPAYGTQNVAGTSSAATLTINVNGLAITEGPALAAATVIVTNSDAAAIYADGPFTVTAEDVAKLGQNVAIWGMAAFAAKRPTGIVEFTAT